MTTLNPDEWVTGWLPHLANPFAPPDPEPAEPSGWHRPGGNPHQPNPELASEFEIQAALKGGWHKPKPPVRKVRKRRKR